MIRPATIHDVPRIQAIINSHAELGKMLFKSLAQLFEDIRDFGVYEDRGPDGCRPGVVTGCVADDHLGRPRRDPLARGRRVVPRPGIGRQLVNWCVDEARRLQIRRLFARRTRTRSSAS